MKKIEARAVSRRRGSRPRATRVQLLCPWARRSTLAAPPPPALPSPQSNGRPCNLGIWDTAGQERFDSLSSFYCRGARAAIICFDLTDRASFECLQSKWVKKVPRLFVGRLGRPTPQPAPRLPTPPHRHCPTSSAAARRHTPRRGTRDTRGGVCVCVTQVLDEAEPGCHICIVGTKLDLVQEPHLSAASLGRSSA